MRWIFVCLMFLMFGSISSAQTYNWTLGLRLGTEIGFTSVIRVAPKTTVEGIVFTSIKKDDIHLTLLGKQHFPLLSKRFNLYLGGGFHRGWIPSEVNGTLVKNPFGVAGVVGGEMTIGRINLGYDWKPVYNIKGGEGAFDSDTSISLRYVIFKKNRKKARERRKKKRRKEREKKRKKRRGDDAPWWKFWDK